MTRVVLVPLEVPTGTRTAVSGYSVGSSLVSRVYHAMSLVRPCTHSLDYVQPMTAHGTAVLLIVHVSGYPDSEENLQRFVTDIAE